MIYGFNLSDLSGLFLLMKTKVFEEIDLNHKTYHLRLQKQAF